MPDKVTILLTFDDGPDSRNPKKKPFINGTETVLECLAKEAVPIKAAFFVQTHSPAKLPTKKGRELATKAYTQEHVLAIHSGSKKDHRCHKLRVNEPADLPGTTNGLDSDMLRARQALKIITNSDPKFVRATYGYTNKACMDVYGRHHLSHIYWDVKCDDVKPFTQKNALDLLRKYTLEKLKRGKRTLVFLFHDLNSRTARWMPTYIAEIKSTVTQAGYLPVFTRTRSEVEVALVTAERAGTDTKCPEKE